MMDKHILFFAMLISTSTGIWSQGQPGEEGPPYYGLELPPYGASIKEFDAFKQEVEKRKRAQPGYVPPPYENALKVLNHGPSFHEGVVLSYDEGSVIELKELALEQGNSKHMRNSGSAIHALGVIHSVDPIAVSFDDLASLIVEIEESEAVKPNASIGILPSSYIGLSYSSDPRAYDFLIKRAVGDRWQDGEIPTATYTTTDGAQNDDGYIATAQSAAIRALSGINDPRIISVLEELEKQTPDDKYYIHHALPSGYYGERDEKFKTLREAAYAKRLKLQSMSAPIQIEEKLTSDIPKSSSDVTEVTPEAFTHKKLPKELSEVEPVEVTEESTNWLLWLIGALVVLGGLAVVIRRKS